MERGGGLIDEAPVFQPSQVVGWLCITSWHVWLVGAEANVCPLESVVVKGNDSDPLFQSDTGAAEPNTENRGSEKKHEPCSQGNPCSHNWAERGAALWESGDCSTFRGLCVHLGISRAERTHDRIGEERNQT